ncbi:MAG: chorismate-binding protein [Acidobacteriota bacterium]
MKPLDYPAARKPIALVQDGFEGRWLRFEAPVAVLVARRVEEVPATFAEVCRRTEGEGLWAAGFVAYEAAPAFDSALAAHPPAVGGAPLLWFALFRRAEVEKGFEAPADSGPFHIGSWRPSVDRRDFGRAIGVIKRAIGRGDTYQVNYTYRLRAAFEGDPLGLFAAMIAAQRCRYGAFLADPEFAICCASPELFFERMGGPQGHRRRLVTRPMKGTAHRGRTLAEDRAAMAALADSPKDRAENVMIVDMLRNDLGRIAEAGSVRVGDLWQAERYPTVLQMTSTVEAQSAATLPEVFAALFPCASITGAPKARTSEIIAALEESPRGPYTGAVGYIGPRGQARFAVAIRTAVVERRADAAARVTYGVGGGMVWDSQAEAEYRETVLKARVLRRAIERPVPWFSLLETMRWSPEEGFFLLEEHLARLAESAEYFAYRWDEEAVRRSLEDFRAPTAQRVRLLVDRTGSPLLEAGPLPAAEDGGEVLTWAPAAVDSKDTFLFHKTTYREVYDRALSGARDAVPETDDALLFNERGEVTETCRANVAVRRGKHLVTPPVRCGLLAGTLRGRLLADGSLEERVIQRSELTADSEIFLVSALRGLRRANWVGRSPQTPR